jgi:hypothetical protein
MDIRRLIMVKETSANKVIMMIIRGTICLSTIAVSCMDLIMYNKLNVVYILGNLAVLYFISD